MNPYQYDTTKKRYRYTSSGRTISHATIRRLRAEYASDQRRWVEGLVEMLTNGDLTLSEFEAEFRLRIKRAHVAEYMLGRGGKNVMTNRDRGHLGGTMTKQYRYVRGFVQDIGDGKLSAAAIKNRANLYFASSRLEFERGHVAAWGLTGDLPAYPGDGICGPQCNCHWEIDETKRLIRAYWRMTASSEHCDDCAAWADQYNPFTVEKERLDT
jgi:hypothetical protein